MIEINAPLTLDEAVDWLNSTLEYMTEDEIKKVATPKQIEQILHLARKASDILEGTER